MSDFIDCHAVVISTSAEQPNTLPFRLNRGIAAAISQHLFPRAFLHLPINSNLEAHST
jgi:hypothetical protein